jgi:ABC-type ATPase with predicted acetyltransferase domain
MPRKIVLQKNHIKVKKIRIFQWECMECGLGEESEVMPKCPVCGLRMEIRVND